MFLGFHIDTKDLSIRLTEQKRAGPTVLFGDLFAAFGSNSVRLNVTQQVRWNIEHSKSTNMLWSYFTSPIDALLWFGEEAGLRA